MQQWRVGDRFRFDNTVVWEITHPPIEDKYYPGVIIRSNGARISEGDRVRWTVDPGDDEYLGNFAKSDNFNKLYDKLSNP